VSIDIGAMKEHAAPKPSNSAHRDLSFSSLVPATKSVAPAWAKRRAVAHAYASAGAGDKGVFALEVELRLHHFRILHSNFAAYAMGQHVFIVAGPLADLGDLVGGLLCGPLIGDGLTNLPTERPPV